MPEIWGDEMKKFFVWTRDIERVISQMQSFRDSV